MEDKKPRIAFFENVKNLVSHDHGNTFRVICEQLDILGYRYVANVLNACEYGNVPQNRERIYIVAFREDADYLKFKMPLPLALTTSLRDVIDFGLQVEPKYYYTKEKCGFYDTLAESMKNHPISRVMYGENWASYWKRQVFDVVLAFIQHAVNVDGIVFEMMVYSDVFR